MTTVVRRGAAAAATLLALGLGVLAPASARAAAPGPWEYWSASFADSHWTLLGHVPGAPGNAHSGQWYFDESDPNVGGVLLDWSCPDGVTPPYGWNTAGPEYNDTSCTLLRDQGVFASGPHSFPVRHGLWHASDSADDFDLVSIRADGSFVAERTGHADYAFTRTGPVETRRTHRIQNGYETIETVRTAPGRLTGRLDYLDLRDPRIHLTVDDFSNDAQLYRTVG